MVICGDERILTHRSCAPHYLHWLANASGDLSVRVTIVSPSLMFDGFTNGNRFCTSALHARRRRCWYLIKRGRVGQSTATEMRRRAIETQNQDVSHARHLPARMFRHTIRLRDESGVSVVRIVSTYVHQRRSGAGSRSYDSSSITTRWLSRPIFSISTHSL